MFHFNCDGDIDLERYMSLRRNEGLDTLKDSAVSSQQGLTSVFMPKSVVTNMSLYAKISSSSSIRITWSKISINFCLSAALRFFIVTLGCG